MKKKQRKRQKELARIGAAVLRAQESERIRQVLDDLGDSNARLVEAQALCRELAAALELARDVVREEAAARRSTGKRETLLGHVDRWEPLVTRGLNPPPTHEQRKHLTTEVIE